MSLLSFLKQDHQKIRTGLVKLMEKTQQADKAVIDQVVHDLQLHMEMEETLLYPKIKEVKDLADRSGELLKEHKAIKILLEKIAHKPVKEIYGLNEIIQNVLDELDHHVEEEENEIIPAYVKHVKQLEVDKLLERLQEFKDVRIKARR